jgi:RNA-directed DNA polymerase
MRCPVCSGLVFCPRHVVDCGGWVNYFPMGHSSRCFAFIRDWVEKMIRSHLARACQRRGFGWRRWSREWLYERLGLFDQYFVSYRPSSTAVSIP